MSFSRRTLSLVTVLLVFGVLIVGVWWRLGGFAREAEAGNVAEGGEADLPETSGGSQFSADMPQAVGGAEVVRDTLWIRVGAAGQAEAFRRTTLTAQVGGVVQELPVRENQRVTEGTPLLQIDSTEYALGVAQAQADLLAAETDYRQLTLFDDEIEDPAVRAERERIARTRSGLDQSHVALRQAQLQLERSRVTAPFAARIADIRVVEGQYVSAGTELMTVVDLDPIKVEVQVLEAELGFLSEGRRAEVQFAAYPGETFIGSIETINPVVDPDSRTGRVTVLLPNHDHRIKPGMYAEVSLDAEALPDRVMVPRAAILERGEGTRRTMLFVYEQNGNVGVAAWRYVNTGRENDTHVEILREGPENGMVEPGEIVLIDGHHYLAHDTAVRLVDNVEAAGGRPSR
ncbi:MAG: efflux RND transporter periplasmic adaptor subunit [Planctomycetes bacterium]|nr:efflux RND transporter periplasmic adaptor subunit [Gemmatimonadota bacterium]MCH8269678.1 efflux RND transporter periplasmic adaptor subunit [Planctomycetota bacterium]